MSNLVSFLKEHGENGLKELEKRFAVKHTRHKTRPNLILFKYDQLNSPMSNPIVQESRGIVLDESDDWKIVVYPYQKFFNMKELANAAVIDWSLPVRAYEKIDGSLITLYFSQDSWHVATSGIPDASGKLNDPTRKAKAKSNDEDEMNDDDPEESETIQSEIVAEPISSPLSPVGSGENRKSFSELFWEVFSLLKYQKPNSDDTRRCFMFELATHQNQVLIRYDEPKLYLHGVRNLDNLEEELPDTFCDKYGWQLAPVKIIKNGKKEFEESILPLVNSLDGLKSEGFVICDAHFNRFKLKCPSYVNMALLHAKDGNEWKRLVAIVQINEGSEFLAYFPSFAELYTKIQERYITVIDYLKKVTEHYAAVETKEFAQMCKVFPEWMRGHIFVVRRTKQDWKVYFASNQRYGFLCGILDPTKSPPEMPSLEQLQILVNGKDKPTTTQNQDSLPN